MIVVMRPNTAEAEVERVVAWLRDAGLQLYVSRGAERTLIGASGDSGTATAEALERVPGVESVLRVGRPFTLAAREFAPEGSVVQVGGVAVGGGTPAVIADVARAPAADTLHGDAAGARAAGATLLQGSAYPPRGGSLEPLELDEARLETLAATARALGLPLVVEVALPQDVARVCRSADALRIAARDMQNAGLLQECGRAARPVVLERGTAARVEEWLVAADAVLARGNRQLILCERGIRTFETANPTFDVSSIPLVERLSHLPVIANPSAGAGRWELVEALALGALAAGADGLVLEVHADAGELPADSASISVASFAGLMAKLRPLAAALGRPLPEAQADTAASS